MTSALRLFSPVFVVLLAIAAGLYQLRIKPLLTAAGAWRTVEPVGNLQQCQKVPELKGCEQIILHQPTGLLYLACSKPEARGQWMPSLSYLNAENRSLDDYVATYNPVTKEIKRLTPLGFDSPRGLSLHGMDVVASTSNSNELFIYLVNHRPPLVGDAQEVGADEAVEVFKTQVGGNSMTHLHTFEDPIMISPNDVVGSADGESVYFTNDAETHDLKGKISMYLHMKKQTIGYCHKLHGCKVAIDHLYGINGITKSPSNDTIYVGHILLGGISVLSKQNDGRLVLDEEIPTLPIDNLSVDDDGVVWAAGQPKSLELLEHIKNPSRKAASSALRISINTGESSFFGTKYLVEKVLEDDGSFVSGTTAVVHDSRRGLLFMHGVAAPHLTVCNLKA